MGFAGRANRICQRELIGFADWIGHFLPGIAAACRGLTKMKLRGNISKSKSLMSEQVYLNQLTVFGKHTVHRAGLSLGSGASPFLENKGPVLKSSSTFSFAPVM